MKTWWNKENNGIRVFAEWAVIALIAFLFWAIVLSIASATLQHFEDGSGIITIKYCIPFSYCWR